MYYLALQPELGLRFSLAKLRIVLESSYPVSGDWFFACSTTGDARDQLNGFAYKVLNHPKNVIPQKKGRGNYNQLIVAIK